MNVTIETGLPPLTRVLSDENKVPKEMVFAQTGFGGALADATTFGGSLQDSFRMAMYRIDEHVVPYSPQPDKLWTQNNNLGFALSKLWDKTITFPKGGNRTWYLGGISYEDRVFILYTREDRQYYCYDLDTAQLLWGPSTQQPGWDMFGRGQIGRDAQLAYGRLYSGYFGGKLYCHDITDGELLWTYELQGVGYESPYGDYNMGYAGTYVADGKIYLTSSEHSPTQPLWRGSYLRCIDAYTGDELWKSLNYVSGWAIADSCIVAGNHYDNRMYVYGKGPSATTVSVRSDVIAEGDTMMITGTVTDQSPGAMGTPAIADEHMDAWMDYMYMKQAMPHDAVGVTVRLTAYDPNGNFQDIGTVTTDSHGNFGKSWLPPVPGEYYVLAEFEGTASYGSSSATTYFVVEETP
jgi:hypothetical protein